MVNNKKMREEGKEREGKRHLHDTRTHTEGDLDREKDTRTEREGRKGRDKHN